MKRTKTIWLLHIWFIWAIIDDLKLLYTNQNTIDYFAYSSFEIAPLFFLLEITVFLLNMGALYYLLKPKQIGLKFAYFALIAAWLYNAITLSLGLFNLEGMKQVFLKHKNMEYTEVIDVIFSVSGFATMLFFTLLFYIFLAYLINRNKKYYQLNI